MGKEIQMSKEIAVRQKSLLKGIIAGLIGGLIATAAKTCAERLYPPRQHGEAEPPLLLAEKIAGHHLAEPGKTIAAESIHWGFGALTGAAYGGLAEFYPAATDKGGASFGMVLASLTHDGLLPAMDLSAPAGQQAPREHTSQMATHLVYGIVTETVRGLIRHLL
jgi:putative membrane protein